MYSDFFQNLPDFLELQRKSFFRLLENGFIDELSKRNPITSSDNNFEFLFYPEYYKLILPKLTMQQAIYAAETYSAQIYVPAQLMDKKKNQIQLEWILLGDLPLMSKRGHFVFNGVPRVIIHQILRGPGIYYTEIKTKTGFLEEDILPIYYADFISMRGTWLRFSIDKKKLMWAEMKKTPKIPLIWFLLAMGLNKKTIFDSMENAERLTENFEILVPDENSNVDTPSMAWKELGSKMLKFGKINVGSLNTAKKESLSILGRQWIFKKFMNPRTYDLGLHGRLCLNRKLGIQLSTTQNTLTAQDVLFATDYLLKVENAKGKLDDIDHLKNRRVRTSCDLIQLQIGIGFIRLEKVIREKMKEFSRIEAEEANFEFSETRHDDEVGSFALAQTSPVERDFFEAKFLPKSKQKIKQNKRNNQTDVFSGSLVIYPSKSQLKKNLTQSKYVKGTLEKPNGTKTFRSNNRQKSVTQIYFDSLIQTQPLNGALKEFFATSPISQFMDQINPLAEITHKRRVTSLGPSGVSRDTATMAIRGIHPTHYGRICPVDTPEGKNAGLVNSLTTYARVNYQGLIETPFYKNYKGQIQKQAGLFYLSAEQEEEILVAPGDIFRSCLNFLPGWSVPAKKFRDFIKVSGKKIDFILISPIQMISIATALVPFLEHDDANRALMGANMQRQAVPLLRPDIPIVGTGLEAKIISDSGQILQAKFGGVIGYSSANKIQIFFLK